LDIISWVYTVRSKRVERNMAEMENFEYTEALKFSEGRKNTQGLKGGVSGIGKAVYTGIREQKMERSGS
jgi:hypothetical protein